MGSYRFIALAIGAIVLGVLVPSARAWISTTMPTTRLSTVAKLDARPPRIIQSAIFSSPDSSESLATIVTALSMDDSLGLLEVAIGFNVSAATTLLEETRRLREQEGVGGNNNYSVESVNQWLDNLLVLGPDRPRRGFWTRSKRLARFSRRARMASLSRVLDRFTPPPSADEMKDSSITTEEEVMQAAQRRRRTLVSILRTLSSPIEGDEDTKIPAIVQLERKAIEAEKEDATNLRNRLPEGLETPKYDVVASGVAGQATVEIREYAPYSVCAFGMGPSTRKANTKMETDAKVQNPEMKGASSFGALAGYLFGKNSESTAMKMTTPVFRAPQLAPDEDGSRQMEFVLPSEYWESVSSAPQPLGESGVVLESKPSEVRAVAMFGGYASAKEVEKRKTQLKAALAKDASWTIAEGSEEATIAEYNDPFTVPWKRLNEVSYRVVESSS